MPFNLDVLTDREVRTTLDEMAQAITSQALAITAQATREGAPMDNPLARTMVSRLRDFCMMNPLVYFGSKINEDPLENVDDIHKILYTMGVNEEEKADFVAY